MLKLFMLERGALSGYGRWVIIIAAQSENEARKMAAENNSEYYADLWLKKETECLRIMTDVTFQETNGASCKEIGMAAADITAGIILSLESFPPSPELLTQNRG